MGSELRKMLNVTSTDLKSLVYNTIRLIEHVRDIDSNRIYNRT